MELVFDILLPLSIFLKLYLSVYLQIYPIDLVLSNRVLPFLDKYNVLLFELEILEKFIKSKRKDAWVVLQSNNFYELDSHINCFPNEKAFANWVKPFLDEKIYYSGTLNLGDFDRFMVIGK